MYPLFFGYGDLALLALRIVLAAVLIAHGWWKVSHLKENGKEFDSMGFRPGAFWGTLIALLEFFGGIAFLFGIFSGWLALLFAIEFLVALIWRIGKGDRFMGGWELDLIIFAAMLLFLGIGAGHFVFGGM